jgi:hypothetical protein
MNAGHSGRNFNEFLKTKQPRRMSISASTASGLRRQAPTNENGSEDMSYFEGNPMTLGRNRKRALSAAKKDFDLLPALVGLQLKKRHRAFILPFRRGCAVAAALPAA